ncbi:MAG: cupin domain-containing protein [Betaproteobacteria bacterium]|nr:cupin domain-containing protein [Betaproteobacteria bacterium]
MSEKPKPVRRIVTVDDKNGKSKAIADGPAPDVRTDPARPGFSSTRIWVTDRTPARINASETLDLPHALEPPAGGSVFRVVTLPPDQAPHPDRQKTRTLDFCLVLQGEVTLMLDTHEVKLNQGDTVVQRGTRHAWSNRSTRPCVIAISSHDAQ